MSHQALPPTLFILGTGVVWELSCHLFGVPAFVLPAPSAIGLVLWQHQALLLRAAAQTLGTTLLGFAAAIAFGLIVGLLLGSSRRVYQAVQPALIGFNAIPRVALVPILVVWFGVGTVPTVCSVFLMAFPPILINVAAGVAGADPTLREAMRLLGARRHHLVFRLGLPSAWPYVFASLKIAVSAAFVGAILAETIAADRGIGHLILVASSRFQVPLAFAGLLVTAAMGIGLYAVIAQLEARTPPRP